VDRLIPEKAALHVPLHPVLGYGEDSRRRIKWVEKLQIK
jgi:hypothetical protein